MNDRGRAHHAAAARGRGASIKDYVLFLLLGLGTGAVYAALGLGIVLVYRGSGVINFAQGAMAMFAVYVYAELRDTGDLVVPVPGLPERIHLADHVSFLAALLIALVCSALLGYLVHLLAFRALRTAPALSKVVASVGIMIVLQAIVVLRFGTSVRSLPAILPDEGVHLFGLVVPRDRLYLAGLVVALAAVLWAVFRFTRFGLATRAAAENEKGASLLGYSPERVSAVNWVAASVVAGLVGILVAPITGLDPVNFTLLVVPALGVALVGRFTSFWVTVAAGLVLGMMQSEITKLQVTYSWIPRVGVKEGLPFVVVIVVLFLIGKKLPARGVIAVEQLPVAPSPRRVGLTALVCGSVVAIAMFTLQGGYRFGLVTSLIVAVFCLSLVVLTGYVGQISLAQMAFAGVAGFTLSKLAHGAGVPFPLAPLLAAATATVAGLLVGIPALRVRGVHLAVVTLAAGVALDEFVFKNPDYTGGFSGSPIPAPRLGGLDLGIRGGSEFPRPAFGLFVLTVLLVLAVAVANLRRSAGGRRMLAVRANERAAAAAGVSVTRTKLVAFTLSSFLAGAGGVLIAYQRGQLSASSFGVFVSLGVLATAYLGGITSVSGAITGGLLAAGGLGFTVLDRTVGLGRYELLLSGVGLILAAILFPEGVAGAVRKGIRVGRSALAHRRGAGEVVAARAASTMPLGEPSFAAETRPASDAARAFEVAATSGSLLEVEDAVVVFAALRAVDEVSLRVEPGRLVGLIGPNGAGKTTVIDALTGFVPLAEGRVVFDGHEIGRLPASSRARRGLARTFQSIQLFEDLTVRENALVAAERPRWWSLVGGLVAPARSDGAEAADWALELVGLAAHADRAPSELSHGQRKLVGVARAIAARPKLLLLDEPAAGLDTHESEQLGARLRSLLDVGITVVLVDHDMSLVLGICDEISVLDVGRVIAHGTPAEIRGDASVIAAYLGERSHEAAAHRRPTPVAPPRPSPSGAPA